MQITVWMIFQENLDPMLAIPGMDQGFISIVTVAIAGMPAVRSQGDDTAFFSALKFRVMENPKTFGKRTHVRHCMKRAVAGRQNAL